MKHKHNQSYVINPQFVFLLSDVNNLCFNCLVRRYWASHSAYLWQRDVCHHVTWSTSLWRLGWFRRRWIEIVWRSRHVERNLYRRPDFCYMTKIYEKIMFRYCTSRRTVFSVVKYRCGVTLKSHVCLFFWIVDVHVFILFIFIFPVKWITRYIFKDSKKGH